MIRLNKYLSEAGFCSRREADRLIEDGKVTVDGLPALTGMKLDETSEVRVEGKLVILEKKKVILAVNKPSGVVCTTDRRWGDKLLEDIVSYPIRVFPVGRLDKDSEGLILMTNQGDILNRIMKAGNFHEKEYIVTVDHDLTSNVIKKLGQGVYLEELNRTTRPCKVQKTGSRTFNIILTQGLNRQIRRMCSSLGYKVIRLVRIRVMNIRLGSLPEGGSRELTDEESRVLMDELKDSENNTELRYQSKADSRKAGPNGRK